jgi:hypothetical protein
LEVDVQHGNFKILWLLFQILILFLVEKWNPPTRSETSKKTEGILGVKKHKMEHFRCHVKRNENAFYVIFAPYGL